MIGVKITRGNTLEARLHAHAARTGRRLELYVESAANKLLEKSRERVPVDLEALKDTSRVRMESHGLTAVAVVGYGPQGITWTGWSAKEERFVTHTPAEYAVWVHLGIAGHVYTVGGPNYLEGPRNDSRDDMRAAGRAALGARL